MFLWDIVLNQIYKYFLIFLSINLKEMKILIKIYIYIYINFNTKHKFASYLLTLE